MFFTARIFPTRIEMQILVLRLSLSLVLGAALLANVNDVRVAAVILAPPRMFLRPAYLQPVLRLRVVVLAGPSSEPVRNQDRNREV